MTGGRDANPPVCLITGGASGIGAACVAAFAAAGYRVALGDVQVNKGKTLAKEHNAFFIRLDVSSESDFATAFNAVQERWGASIAWSTMLRSPACSGRSRRSRSTSTSMPAP